MITVSWQQHIVVRIRHGESAALGELYDRLAGRVYRLAVAMTATIPAAEEITTTSSSRHGATRKH
jgi:hypothetical protein